MFSKFSLVTTGLRRMAPRYTIAIGQGPTSLPGMSCFSTTGKADSVAKNENIFARGRGMAKKYGLTYTISYGILTWSSIGTSFYYII
jgi:hypothetical protein